MTILTQNFETGTNCALPLREKIKLNEIYPIITLGGDLMPRVDKNTRGKAMKKEKPKPIYTGLPRKKYWHLYSLQNLQSEKLVKIVNKVLNHEYVLIK